MSDHGVFFFFFSFFHNFHAVNSHKSQFADLVAAARKSKKTHPSAPKPPSLILKDSTKMPEDSKAIELSDDDSTRDGMESSMDERANDPLEEVPGSPISRNSSTHSMSSLFDDTILDSSGGDYCINVSTRTW